LGLPVEYLRPRFHKDACSIQFKEGLMRKILILAVTILTAVSVAGCVSGKGKAPIGKGKGKAPVVQTKG
jgi:hypothetical protein